MIDKPSPRDELADLIDEALERRSSKPDSIQAWDQDEDLLPLADAILAAGWRPGAELLSRDDRRGLAAVFGFELGEEETRRRLIEEGWRPPSEVEPSAVWEITIGVPSDLDTELRHDLFTRVADVVHDWEPDDRDGWDVDVFGHPASFLREEVNRLRGEVGKLDRLLRAASSTQPSATAEHDTEADAWYIRVLDEDVHHTTESAPANLDWTRDGRLIGVELLGPLRRDQPAPDGWYPAAMREHDRANAAELDRTAAARRAASWWEAAKTLNRWGTAHRELHRAALVKIANLTAVRDELAHQRDDHRARADAAEAKLRQVREVITEDAETRARFNVDTSTSYGPRFLSRIRAIVERESATRCVNDTNGDGDCAACAHNPNAPCRSASEEPTCTCDRPVARCSCRIADLCKAAADKLDTEETTP